MAIQARMISDLEGSDAYNPGTGTKFNIGMTEAGRFIMSKKFDQNHLLTRIDFECTGGRFLSAGNKAVIRVYQYEQETDARYLDITGTGSFSTDISLEVTSGRGVDRLVIVDAWVATEDVPTKNTLVGAGVNSNPFKGRLEIHGRALRSVTT